MAANAILIRRGIGLVDITGLRGNELLARITTMPR